MMVFSVIGGDLRSAKLIDLLSKNPNFKVHHFGFEKLSTKKLKDLDIEPKKFSETSLNSLRESIESCDVILLPLPIIKGDFLNAPFNNSSILISEIMKYRRESHIVLAGNVKEDYLIKYPYIIDYYADEGLVIFNSIATAEGTVAIAIETSFRQIHGSKCLVLGFGRVGKILSQVLKSLNGNVSVCARKETDLAYIESYGMKAINFSDLETEVSKFDFIFSSVPKLIMTKKILQNVSKETLIIDLADGNGSVDFDSAKIFKLKVIHECGIPGRFVPITAAENIYRTIIKIIDSLPIQSNPIQIGVQH